MQKVKGTKIQIPDALKQDLPHTMFGKILAATPVVMTVLATMLAGLASSEMNRAQYDRSLAAQQQSKAGDQWSFFQAKRLRGALQKNAVDLMLVGGGVPRFDLDDLRNAAESLPRVTRTGDQVSAQAQQVNVELLQLLNSPAARASLALIQKCELPAMEPAPALDTKLKSAMQAVENSSPDAELFPLMAQISTQDLEAALKGAREHAQALDDATRPVNQTLDTLDNLIARRAGLLSAAAPGENSPAGLVREFTAARLRFTALRYETEARLNQVIANLYELQVRKSNISADRHHRRSQRFFFGMLGAQAAVIIATFAMAARNRNLLWSLAAAAGLAAVALAIYVYLYV